MLIRLLLSVASLTVGLAGGVVIECRYPVTEFLRGDPTGLCAAAGGLGVETGTWVGVGLGLFAVIALILIWVPVARRRSRRQRQPIESLQDNLSRLVEHGEARDSERPADQSGADVLHVMRLERRLEAIESALAVDTVPTREVTEQWMRLLRETNELHNRGHIPTEDFKGLNTRLLDLFSPGGGRSDGNEQRERTGSTPPGR